jgi:hypothetical protein
MAARDPELTSRTLVDGLPVARMNATILVLEKGMICGSCRSRCSARGLAGVPLMQMAGYLWLLVERSTPGPRAYSEHAGENPGQMTLIREAADRRHFRQRQPVISQFLLGHLDAMHQ